MKNFVLFFVFITISVNIISSEQEKKLMKIFVFASSRSPMNNLLAKNQITDLIDRGHDVTIYSFGKGDFFKAPGRDAVNKYGLVDKIVAEIPMSFDSYDIVIFQMPIQGHTFNIRKTHNFKGKIITCGHGQDIASDVNSQTYDECFKSCDSDLLLPLLLEFPGRVGW